MKQRAGYNKYLFPSKNPQDGFEDLILVAIIKTRKDQEVDASIFEARIRRGQDVAKFNTYY